jgi:hypothetical protein
MVIFRKKLRKEASETIILSAKADAMMKRMESG